LVQLSEIALEVKRGVADALVLRGLIFFTRRALWIFALGLSSSQAHEQFRWIV